MTINLDDLDPDQTHVVAAVLVAQLRDVHAMSWSLSERHLSAADQLKQRLEAQWSQGTLDETDTGLLMALCVTTDDIDHPALTESQERALTVLMDAALARLDQHVAPSRS